MKSRGKPQLYAKPQPVRGRMVPVTQELHPFDLNGDLIEEPVHSRWLLTTCIAGIAATLIVGGGLLDIFGHNAVPNNAQAAINKKEITGSADSETPLATASINPAEQGENVQTTEVIPERDLSGSFNYPEITSDDLPYGDGKTIVLDAEIEAAEAESENITTITKTPPAEPVDETFKVASGTDLIDELTERGVTREAAEALTAAIEPVLPSKMIKPGTEFEITLDRQQDFYGRDVTFPVELSFKPGPKETIVVEADEDGRFVARIEGKKDGATSLYAQVNHFRTRTKVGSSLYGTAKDNKIPDYIVAELTRVFSYDVDFQRQVKANDTFEVFYGNPLTGSSSKRKVLHYAQLTLEGKTKTYFRFTNADGITDYYDENGLSASKSLLKMPVSGARLTSGFGMRKHPLLGYSKMHSGIDFGVPTGTPIRAAGAGTVDIAGRHGAYGNTIVIQHGGKYKTLYAHMSKLASGIRRGSKINQGQIIGYVGSTGRSTGPHLHYEVRVKDKPINPTRIKAAGGKQLAGKDLQKYKSMKDRVLAMMKTAPSATQVAQASQ